MTEKFIFKDPKKDDFNRQTEFRKGSIRPLRAWMWIMGSVICIWGMVFTGVYFYNLCKHKRLHHPVLFITHVNSEGEPLPTAYLEELLHLSVDHPQTLSAFDVHRAEKQLLSSPLIKEAHVHLSPPYALYVDYKARTPIAYVQRYKNVVIDDEGYLFPLYPFMTPKRLPEICLGNIPCEWNKPINSKEFSLALVLYTLLASENVDSIDVSKAYADSYGTREIVLSLKGVYPCFLRLSTKNYVQEWKNYLQLREKLIFTSNEEKKIIDLRIPQLGFIAPK